MVYIVIKYDKYTQQQQNKRIPLVFLQKRNAQRNNFQPTKHSPIANIYTSIFENLKAYKKHPNLRH